jgi:signal transduction histidine kinase
MERGLIPAVVDLADRMPLPTSVAVSDRTMTLPPTVESTAYFVIAEALSNAVKHAQATRLDVRVDREGNRLIIVVIDDGVGGAVAGTGAGLSGIANRVDVLGGRLTVESPPGAGTRLRVELPCGS